MTRDNEIYFGRLNSKAWHYFNRRIQRNESYEIEVTQSSDVSHLGNVCVQGGQDLISLLLFFQDYDDFGVLRGPVESSLSEGGVD